MQQLFERQTKELEQLLGNLGSFHEQVTRASEHLKEAFLKGYNAYVAGNGGSASQAQHLAEELIGRYRTDRKPYPMISLTADGTALTCIGNDFGFSDIFSRQVEALGKEGDVFVALSTSGNSENILKAVDSARANGMTVIGFTGTTGKLRELADIAIEVPTTKTERMQELHLHAIHLICESFEDTMRDPSL
jgi:D-sedoheptulose 7-phosphate isomerase